MKKIKLFGIALIAIILISSCSASDTLKCKQNVQKEFPNAISILKPEHLNSFQFIVIDSDNSIWFVETMSVKSAKVTSKEKIYKFN